MPDKEPLPADVARADSPAAMARRLASPAHIAQLCGWCARVAREEGAQALWREIDFRLRLALHKDTWRYRADLPTRRQLRRQKAAGVPGGPTISVCVPLPAASPARPPPGTAASSIPNWKKTAASR